jgi:pimeloyl-ACP methyl ester carboxylesterase
MPQFNSEGLTLVYDDIGPREGRPVVLVHGFTSNRKENWQRLGRSRLSLATPKRFTLLMLGGVGGKLFDPRPPGYPMAEAMEADDPDTIADPILRSFRRFADQQGEDRLALAALNRGADAPFQKADVSKLSVETLIVAGARDDLAGDPYELAALIPDAKAVALPGSDHFSAIPHALFKASVFDFLDGTLE